MKILIDFFPILLFFGAYKMYDIYIGTGVLMAATVLQMALIYGIDRRLQALHKITLVLVLVFGALTLALHDDRFRCRARQGLLPRGPRGRPDELRRLHGDPYDKRRFLVSLFL